MENLAGFLVPLAIVGMIIARLVMAGVAQSRENKQRQPQQQTTPQSLQRRPSSRTSSSSQPQRRRESSPDWMEEWGGGAPPPPGQGQAPQRPTPPAPRPEPRTSRPSGPSTAERIEERAARFEERLEWRQREEVKRRPLPPEVAQRPLPTAPPLEVVPLEIEARPREARTYRPDLHTGAYVIRPDRDRALASLSNPARVRESFLIMEVLRRPVSLREGDEEMG